MAYETQKHMNQFIEGDSKATTCKFLLVMAAIDVIQEKTPYADIPASRIYCRLGFWLSNGWNTITLLLKRNCRKKTAKTLPQTLSLSRRCSSWSPYYRTQKSDILFYTELLQGKLDETIEPVVYNLYKKIRDTIKNQSMKYISRSMYRHTYQIVQPVPSLSGMRRPGRGYFIPSAHRSVLQRRCGVSVSRDTEY